MKNSKLILIQGSDVQENWIKTKQVPRQLRECYKGIYDTLIPNHKPVKNMPRMIAIASCYPGEGVSTIATNLAQMLCFSTNSRVLYVDANYLKPVAHKIFHVPQNPGLGELLWEGPVKEPTLRLTSIPNLLVLPAGTASMGPLQFESEVIPDLMNVLRAKFQYVVFDVPSFSETHSILKLLQMMDGVILTVQAERVRWEVARRFQEELSRNGDNLIGAVLNRRKFYVPKWLYRTI